MSYQAKAKSSQPSNGFIRPTMSKRPKPVDTKIKVGASKSQVLPEIPSEMNYFCGEVINVPPITRSEVRVFLSSTFTDYQVERNALVRHAYPELKSFAASLALDFQVVDMRWGVTDDAANEHIVKDLCLREIANCQRLSFGPNFVCLLGDRYGYMPFPSEIEAGEFKRLKDVALESRLPDCELLEEWYKVDNNAVPASCILQPVTSKFVHFGDYTPGMEDRRRDAMKSWSDVDTKLRKLLLESAMLAHERGMLTADGLYHYTRSVTEAEVHAGILAATFPRNSTLCYLRTFTDLASDGDVTDPVVGRHIDVRSDGSTPTIDEDAQEQLKALKTFKIPQKLPESNVAKFELVWRPGGVDINEEEHDDYIKLFCRKFVSDMKTLIKTQKTHQLEHQRQLGKLLTDLREEVFHHLRFCGTKLEVFCGRETEIETVKSYMVKGQCRQPLVIHASSGCGKTALSAILARMCKITLGKNSVLLIRFLGTSADSSNLFKVIRSLCQQICLVYNVNYQPKSCNNFSKAAKHFHHLISFVSQRYTKERPLVIVLDSLDQLDVGETKSPSVNWLPKLCPPGVHMLLSTLPDDKNNWLSTLQSHLPDARGYIDLQPLDHQTSQLIIEAYLARKSRAVNKKQFHLIIDAMDKYPRPLFLKLLLDQACQWKSYQGMAEEKFPKNVREAISNLFKKLQSRYGKLLVDYSLGYLTVGVNGLSEVEMEDVLSCNNQVLNEVYQYHNPPSSDLVRIPPLLWSRIVNDIRDYLVERQTDGKTTLFWYHRQFIETAHQYFVKPRESELHADLACLYLARSGVQKTVQLTRRNLQLEACDRGVTEQPLVSSNKRMLNSLPHHLLKAGNVDKLLNTTYCNLDFLSAYIEAFSITDLSQSLNEAHRVTKNSVLETLRDFLRFSETVIPNKVQLAIQLLGQLGSRKETALQTLCEQCTSTIQQNKDPVLMPVGGCLPSSSSELKAYVGNVTSVICVSQDMSLIAVRAMNRNSKLTVPKIFSTEFLSTISVCSELSRDLGAIVDGQFTDDRKWLFILAMKEILVYSVQTGENLYQSGININNAGFLNNAFAVSSNKKFLIISGKERLCIGEDVGKVPGIPKYNVGHHKTYKFPDVVMATVAIDFITDSSTAVSVHDVLKDEQESSYICVWDCGTKKQEWCYYLPSRCRKSGIVGWNDKIYLGCDDGRIRYLEPLLKIDICIRTIELGKNLKLSPIVSLNLNPDIQRMSALRQDNMILILSVDGLVNCLTLDSSPNKLVRISDSKNCLSATNAGMLHIWRYEENRKLYERQIHQCKVDFLLPLNDEFVITHSCKEGALNLWNFGSSLAKVDMTSESRASMLELDTDPEIQQQNVLHACLSADGRWLVTCVESGQPIIWTLVHDPVHFMYVAACHTEDVCDFICFGKRDEFILARKLETRTMICCYLLASPGSYGRLNRQFQNETVCGEICASPSSIGIGACHVITADSTVVTGSLTLIPGAVNIFTLKHGHLLKSINLMSLSAKTIDGLRFTHCGRYVTITYNDSYIQALFLNTEVEELELARVINDYDGDGDSKRVEQLSRCFCLVKRQTLIVDTKAIKNSRCNAFSEYEGGLLLACHGICPLWNMKTDEKLLMEKMTNSRQWLKHSTAWYFYERSGDLTSTNVDGSMGQTAVTSLGVTGDGSVIVTGAEDGSVIVWLKTVALRNQSVDGMGPRSKRFLEGHTGLITSILIRSCLKTVITASKDRTIRLWDIGSENAVQLTVLHVHSVPEKLWFIDARPGQRVKVNPDLKPSSNGESYIVAHCSDIVKNHVIAVQLRLNSAA